LFNQSIDLFFPAENELGQWVGGVKENVWHREGERDEEAKVTCCFEIDL
jgi:hypothetical protein